jgi:hypothetical protein
MTVCFGVLCKYIPQMEFMSVLLSDEPAMEPSINFYQRLVARDKDETLALAEAYLQAHTLEATFDNLLIPALHATKRDYELGTLTDEDVQLITQTTRAIIEEFGARSVRSLPSQTVSGDLTMPASNAPPPTPILGCPADDEMDELALLMLQQLLDPTHYQMQITSAEMLVAEVLSVVERQQVRFLCIVALLPGALAPTRYLCKRLRASFPECKIVAGLLGVEGDSDKVRGPLREAGAHEVGTTLRETYNQVMHWSQLVATGDTSSSSSAS